MRENETQFGRQNVVKERETEITEICFFTKVTLEHAISCSCRAEPIPIIFSFLAFLEDDLEFPIANVILTVLVGLAICTIFVYLGVNDKSSLDKIRNNKFLILLINLVTCDCAH